LRFNITEGRIMAILIGNVDTGFDEF